jgi:hypothetical protein
MDYFWEDVKDFVVQWFLLFVMFLLGFCGGAFTHKCATPQQRQQQAWENYLEARDE